VARVAPRLRHGSNGRDQMPAFGQAYKPEELPDVAAYILAEIKKP
jgi:mono/diheme cytochrome c family protein